MIRKIGLAVLSVIMIAESVALADSAANYTGSTGVKPNQVEVTEASSYSNVMITKVPDNANQASELVYVNQDTNGFSATVDFLIKENPSYGKYKVRMGSDSGATLTEYFYIGIDKPADDISAVTMQRVGEETDPKGVGYWNVGYILEVPISAYNNFNSVKVAYDSDDNYVENRSSSDIKTGGYNKVAEMAAPYYKNWPGSISGEGNVKLAFQINHVPAAYKDSITVYMSNSSVSDTKLNQ